MLVDEGLDLVDLFAEVMPDEARASNCRSAELKPVALVASVVLVEGLGEEVGEFTIAERPTGPVDAVLARAAGQLPPDVSKLTRLAVKRFFFDFW